MIIGIIGAMNEEVEELLKVVELEKKVVKAKMEFNVGEVYNKKAVIVTSGIGKVNAAICTQILIDDFNVDCIINVGIAGGVREDVYPGDVIIADNLVQHDIDTSFFGDKIGQVPRLDTFDFKCDEKLVEIVHNVCKEIKEYNYFKGRIVSGDQFVADADKLKWFKSEFNAWGCEMEGASIAQVCYLNQVPFVVIRSISDNAVNGTHMDYDKFKVIALKNSFNIINNMLKIM